MDGWMVVDVGGGGRHIAYPNTHLNESATIARRDFAAAFPLSQICRGFVRIGYFYYYNNKTKQN